MISRMDKGGPEPWPGPYGSGEGPGGAESRCPRSPGPGSPGLSATRLLAGGGTDMEDYAGAARGIRPVRCRCARPPGTWMARYRLHCPFFSIGPLADEIPSGFDPGSSKAKGLILTFEDWPPDGEDTDPLLRKLHSAGLKVTRKFPRFRVWVFEWDEWQEGRRAENLCIELLLDDRTSSLLESCEPDYCCIPPVRRPAATRHHAGPISMRSPQGARLGPPAGSQLTQATGYGGSASG